MVQIGIPGGAGAKLATTLATRAIQAKKAGKLVKFNAANIKKGTAKAKQLSILGKPSPYRWLAVSQSPYYDFLKRNNLDRGIL